MSACNNNCGRSCVAEHNNMQHILCIATYLTTVLCNTHLYCHGVLRHEWGERGGGGWLGKHGKGQIVGSEQHNNIYIYIPIYIYIHIYRYMYINIYVYICIHTYRAHYTDIGVNRLAFSLYMYLSMSLSLYIYIYTHTYTDLCRDNVVMHHAD